MSKKWWLLLVVIIVIILIVAVGMFVLKESKAPVVGGDKDSHGCIGSAGYSWCESSNKCYRPWEESCESAGTFAEEGNLTKPQGSATWILVYEKPGQPALTAILNFNKDSICILGETSKDCEKDLKVGDRVQVQGTTSDGKVIVSKLTIIPAVD